MKKYLLAILPFMAVAQPKGYWQQAVDYTMAIDMDTKNHQFDGTQTLVYTNNSPDTLHEVFYHLYFNAFQPGSMMDVRSRNIADPDRRVGDRISKLDKDEIGYHKVSSLMLNGQPVSFKITETVLHAQLPTPILPGEKASFKMEFESQVPVQIRRSGRDNAEGVDYTMTQWYPKIANYDEDGWHPDPYVAREFYAPFGSFDVKITIDKNQKLGGTGVLQNQSDFWKANALGTGVQVMDFIKTKGKKRTWHFKADRVHDFAWAADEDYQHYKFVGADGPELNFYFLDDYITTWEKLPKATQRFFELMSQNFGQYPYSQFSVIQGGDGGMEYPMCTMLKGTGKLNGLVGVMAHESAHNWFYGVLASNEAQYPWMDEGFTSYAEDEVLNLMSQDPKINPHQNAYRNYYFLVEKGQQEPLATPADYYARNRTYGINAYSRGAIFLAQLKYIVGVETFERGMLEYFERWKFKHPDPKNFIRVMEDVSDIQLDWYLNFWVNTTKTIDYAIDDTLVEKNDSLQLTFKKLGEMPMPLDITIHMEEGEDLHYNIPLVSMFGTKQAEHPNLQVLDPWAWTSPEYSFKIPVKKDDVRAIIIDPYQFMADINPENNVLLLAEDLKEKVEKKEE